tara:strand:- start:1768 stop:2097 length:330 start_codon:yes stop_codon:yes gene_type:complete
MIKIKSKKICHSKDNKTYAYEINIENDPLKYELNYNYANSDYYKGVSATLSIVRDNFCRAIACKRLKYIKRMTLKQIHNVFDEYNLNKSKGEILLNELYCHYKNNKYQL